MSEAPTPHRRRPPLLAPFRVLRARPRLLICALVGSGVGFVLPLEMRDVTRALVAWNVAVGLYLALALNMIIASNHHSIRRRARFLDEGRNVILFLSAAAACATMGAIIAELGPVKNMAGATKLAHIGLTILTVLLSWLFIHLTFAFHYAHEFYLECAAAPEAPPQTRGGLQFPGTPQPQYLDFLYFSYVIGVACQTADVSATSTTMRAIALAQGILSFFFNTAIVALTVNIASGYVG